jgi:spore cortex biosynthesis protein yabQ
MKNLTENQAYLFLIYCLCGIIIGIFFDIFRILRKSFKTNDFVTYIEDILFGIVTGIFLIIILFIFSNGTLRFYIFLALILGLLVYFTLISKYFVKFNVLIITTIKNVILKILRIILYPIIKIWTIIRKKMLKSIKILTINIKSIIIHKNKTEKKSKKEKNKKDFTQKCRNI